MNHTLSLATSRCWLQVDLDTLAANAESARALCAPAALIPVLKANAYGLGAVPVARHLYAQNLRLLAVATVFEALELKQALPGADILVMGPSFGVQLPEAVRAGLILALYEPAQAASLSAAAQSLSLPARVHVKLNTGLNRIGFDADGGLGEAIRAAQLPGIRVEGAFTHLALHGPAADQAQLDLLQSAKSALEAAGIPVPMLHALDSIGMVRYPDHKLDAVRAGAWLYGVTPSRYEGTSRCQLPAQFKSRVVQLRRLPKGSFIGYDDEHPLTRDALIATVSAGYADGYPRKNNAGLACIRGQRAHVVGLIGMDQMMLDATDASGIEVGDEVTLFGGPISLDEHAAVFGINRNEALSRVARRVPRVYVSGGQPVCVADYNTFPEEQPL